VLVNCCAVNVAVTLVAPLSVTSHVPVPEQGAPQPANVELLPGVAIKVTVAPGVKNCEQVPVAQLRPAGLLVTVPVLVPASVTLNGS